MSSSSFYVGEQHPGISREKCVVTLVKDSNNDVMNITRRCMPKATDENYCGIEVKSNRGISTKLCCCNEDDCNNDVFVTGCVNETPTIPNFSCHFKSNLEETSSAVIPCDSKDS